MKTCLVLDDLFTILASDCPVIAILSHLPTSNPHQYRFPFDTDSSNPIDTLPSSDPIPPPDLFSKPRNFLIPPGIPLHLLAINPPFLLVSILDTKGYEHGPYILDYGKVLLTTISSTFLTAMISFGQSRPSPNPFLSTLKTARTGVALNPQRSRPLSLPTPSSPPPPPPQIPP